YLDPSFTPPGSSTTYHNQEKLAAVPQIFYTYSQEDCPVSAGIGVYSPYGLADRWPQTTGFRTVAKRACLTYASINPVVAFKFSDTFSVGGGITVNYAKADLRQGLFWPAQANDGFRFVGDGWDVGYNLGALWKADEKLSFGVSFRSGTEVNLEGHIRDHNNVSLGP